MYKIFLGIIIFCLASFSVAQTLFSFQPPPPVNRTTNSSIPQPTIKTMSPEDFQKNVHSASQQNQTDADKKMADFLAKHPPIPLPPPPKTTKENPASPSSTTSTQISTENKTPAENRSTEEAPPPPSFEEPKEVAPAVPPPPPQQAQPYTGFVGGTTNKNTGSAAPAPGSPPASGGWNIKY